MTRRTLAIALVCCATAGSLHAQEKKDPRKLVGQEATLCGAVVTYTNPGDACDVRLDFSQPSWRPLFYAQIPDEVRAMFQRRPEEQFLGQQVCVSGKVERDKERVPYIVVNNPSQFEQGTTNAARPVFAPGTSLMCEKGITPAKLIKEVRPSYTTDVFLKRLEGTVLLDAVIGVEGTITDTVVIFADAPDFIPLAEEALRQWKFAPATRGGIPLPVIAAIEITFKM